MAMKIHISVFWLIMPYLKAYHEVPRQRQIIQLSATTCYSNAVFWVILVSFAAITLYVASQWVFIVVW